MKLPQTVLPKPKSGPGNNDTALGRPDIRDWAGRIAGCCRAIRKATNVKLDADRPDCLLVGKFHGRGRCRSAPAVLRAVVIAYGRPFSRVFVLSSNSFAAVSSTDQP
jgi:hypothetical protein